MAHRSGGKRLERRQEAAGSRPRPAWLAGAFASTQLGAALDRLGLRSSGSKEERIERLVESWVPPREVAEGIELTELRDVARELELKTSGANAEIVERITNHFAHDRDLVVVAALPEPPIEPKDLVRPQFVALFAKRTLGRPRDNGVSQAPLARFDAAVLPAPTVETSPTPITSAPEPMEATALEKPSEEHPFGAPPKDLPPLDPPAPTRILDTTGVRIERIDLAKKGDRKRFLDMVAPLYAGDPNYIEPLRMERMQFLDAKNNIALRDIEMYAMIAHQNGRPVGRLTAHVDRAYDRYHGTRSGWFGFFECINDRKVAHAMFAEGVKWLKEKGAVDVVGPMNFNTNHQCGLLIENFKRPAVVEMTYNPQYYQELIESFGFGKAKDLYAWWIDVEAGIQNPKVARINKLADRVRKREGVVIRNVAVKDFDREVKTMFDLYNEAWQKNWGFVPVSEDEFIHIAKNLKPIVREELLLVVEVKGRPVGFSVTLPDVNEVMPKDGKLFPFGWAGLVFGLKKIKRARLMVLGMVPEFRKRGLEALMFIETAVRAKQLGMNGGEIGWTLEDNWLINRAIESMDGRLDRRYRLFGLTL